MSIIGDRLKKLRENAGLTQKQLADKFNVGYSTFSQYESGQRIPSDDVKLQIADYFNVSLDFLMGNENKKPKLIQLNEKDKKDIAKQVEDMLEGLADSNPITFELDGKEIDDELKEILRNSLQNTLEFARLKAKEKYTPKKFKK